MKTVILAGGMGNRPAEETDNRPKPITDNYPSFLQLRNQTS